ncbi:hypothetical protein Patl1_27388 [Pistacia atlantica]|uniref:Uncharacterized protein n=1 Tax=Pistacia atlantica TaxID=434234 RepID=A0ACC1BCB1_9ROSI|nr:hypothetical protein Patl1_27388 [Pistacia atlantica]
MMLWKSMDRYSHLIELLTLIRHRFVLQLDVFQLVGLPLIENCLAGFNSSAVAYGFLHVSEKLITPDREWKDLYTMWGLANALLEENLSSDQQGLTHRIFERLFSRINEVRFKFFRIQLVESEPKNQLLVNKNVKSNFERIAAPPSCVWR